MEREARNFSILEKNKQRGKGERKKKKTSRTGEKKNRCMVTLKLKINRERPLLSRYAKNTDNEPTQVKILGRVGETTHHLKNSQDTGSFVATNKEL